MPSELLAPPEAPAPLRRDVRLLSTILGRVLVETEGQDLLDDVERLRRATIALRRTPGAERRAVVHRVVRSFDPRRAEQVARAFTCYFQLANLAEERHRVRELTARSHGREPLEESIDSAATELRAQGHEDLGRAVRSLDVMPVITAHPTEARRRSTLETLWRIGDLLARMDDPSPAPAARQEIERRLSEEITVLWRTDPVRSRKPAPLDEVRAVMALFDQTIFQLLPALCREVDRAAAPDSGARAPRFDGVPVRWGTWVGGDRDGNAQVTADVTLSAARISSQHILLGLEAATRRIARSLPVADVDVPPAKALVRSIERDAELFPRAAAELRRKLPGMSHRLKLGFCAHRLAATRARSGARYERSDDFLADLRTVQRSFESAGAARLAFGDLQHLVWQVEAFGFHLAELEVRQHSDVLATAAGELRRRPPAHPSRTLREAMETLRSMHEIQRTIGPNACRRFVVSFTRDASDIEAVHRLARAAVKGRGFELDVVPLFETREHLDRIVEVCDKIVELPTVRRRLAREGAVFEIMLGYSDSAKRSGVLAANVALYRAQVELVAWAERRGIAVRVFHGRGGALGRGGGPTNRAIMGQPAGSLRGRFKVTEQGEVAFSRYGEPALARRHLEQIVHALLIASTPEHEAEARRCWDAFGPLVGPMADASEVRWRGLVERPGFVEFFGRATPMREIEGLPIGSRPSRRRESLSLDDVRAIPWVFAWGQSRVSLPGWYGVGTAFESVVSVPDGLRRLREMYRRWPFFSSLLENVQLSLAKADRQVAQSYLEAAGDESIAADILEELDRTLELVLQVSEQDALLADRPVLRRAIDLRNPYVDALSFLQLRHLPKARTGDARAARIVAITISGVAAGLQNTG